MPIFGRVLIINGCWILSKAFCTSIDFIIWFLSFHLLVWCITLIDLHIVKYPFIPRIHPLNHGEWTFWRVAEFVLLKFCWRFLHLSLSVILASSFLFSCCLCLVLASEWWWPHWTSLEVFLPLQFFERFLEK